MKEKVTYIIQAVGILLVLGGGAVAFKHPGISISIGLGLVLFWGGWWLRKKGIL